MSLPLWLPYMRIGLNNLNLKGRTRPRKRNYLGRCQFFWWPPFSFFDFFFWIWAVWWLLPGFYLLLQTSTKSKKALCQLKIIQTKTQQINNEGGETRSHQGVSDVPCHRALPHEFHAPYGQQDRIQSGQNHCKTYRKSRTCTIFGSTA